MKLNDLLTGLLKLPGLSNTGWKTSTGLIVLALPLLDQLYAIKYVGSPHFFTDEWAKVTAGAGAFLAVLGNYHAQLVADTEPKLPPPPNV